MAAARPFLKMHGAGNDFVVLDARAHPLDLAPAAAARIADRHRGVGCDQIILIEPDDGAAAFMRILNADGSESGACGNATRCVAALLAGETGARRLAIRTNAGLLPAEIKGPTLVEVDMGAPKLGWEDIPLAEPADTLSLRLALGPVQNPAACSMGNPHATFFVDDLTHLQIETIGPKLEHARLFPERANIGFARIDAPDRIRLRVWERGAGLTLACGSGACAALVNAHRRGLAARRAEIEMDGGTLTLTWRDDGHVLMEGPVALVFEGELDAAMLAP
ncbi:MULTISPECIES: diaminopimelate epimerase [Acidiphilium]|jgi:diaminopimelate epimerase|uniref:Diaminopimelate epimerase n=2 Tax=Acidiphilium TaxID=522 RepID=F0J424_ACIMA|nr:MULTISPECIES: diaminopimelate epimerase [Acidiphilium]MBU6357475.1 diaminopimelate epimerase [Rhodospirillales bacterium]KDM66566.1 diaminopimelate epimerase DapF [Acidiphilium sp. JA12-A1]MDE2326870.1 diaminopimelate epimerase [Rhodospirillales bacterium]UNC14126.1 diaminopimelate epimerase [Acidiphilium multivorum]BAJ82165.1 diaminopimelate epimerase [Acidiphilium multivorum AIU301]